MTAWRRWAAGLALLGLAPGGPVEVAAAPPGVERPALSADERREFEARRAAVLARAVEAARAAAECLHVRARVRESLATLEEVRSVEVGFVLLTADPPQMPVRFAIALTSGRVVADRVLVPLPLRPRVVPLRAFPEGPEPPACPAAP